MSEKRFLLIQPKRIGDVLFTTASIRALRTAYPKATIDFLTEEPSYELLKNNPYLNNVIVKKVSSYTKAVMVGLSLRKNRYDYLIDFYSHPLTAVMSFITGAKVRVSVSKGSRDIFYTNPVKIDYDNPYGVNHKLQLLQPLGIYNDDIKMDFFITDEDRRYVKALMNDLGVKDDDLFITVSPVSRRGYKVWPAKNFAEVCDYLIENYNAKVMINYGPNEEEFAKDVKKLMKHKPLPDVKLFSIAKLKAVYELTKLNISNDNGPCHFAVSAGAKVITIYGRPFGAGASPIDKNVIFFDIDLPCKKACTYPKCGIECLTHTTPAMVIEASKKLLKLK